MHLIFNKILYSSTKKIFKRQNFFMLTYLLRPKCVIAKDVKNCTYCCYVICATLRVREGGNALAPNRRNSLPCTVRTCWASNGPTLIIEKFFKNKIKVGGVVCYKLVILVILSRYYYDDNGREDFS